MSDEQEAAVKIQGLVRGHQARQEVKDSVTPHGASKSVQVMLRVRPFNSKELAALGDDLEPVVFPNAQGTLVEVRDVEGHKKDERFGLDRVFWSIPASQVESPTEFSGQAEVYQHVGAPALEQLLDGFNGCILAYGQTSSGKTFTMLGSDEDPGIIPQMYQQLFVRMESMQKAQGGDGDGPKSVLVQCTMSYLEIYHAKKELIRDLLVAKSRDLSVREDRKLGPVVPGLQKETVRSWEQVKKLLDLGGRHRAVAATDMNAHSSRSHAVVQLNLDVIEHWGEVAGKDVTRKRHSQMNLVDLAGSERVQKSGVSGVAFQEAIGINTSLTTLGRVIDDLIRRQEDKSHAHHVAYRDSLLTFLLKDSLGGNSLTIMMAAVSPCVSNYEETLSTLRYAARARKIVNRVQRNEDEHSAMIRDLQDQLQALKDQKATGGLSDEEVEKLHKELEEHDEMIKSLEADRNKQVEELHMKEEKWEKEQVELEAHHLQEIEQIKAALEEELSTTVAKHELREAAAKKKIYAHMWTGAADRGRVQAVEEKLEGMMRERSEFGARADKAEKQLHESEARLHDLDDELHRKEDALRGAKSELEMLKSKDQAMFSSMIAEKDQKILEIEAECKKQRREHAAVQTRIRQLEEEHAAEVRRKVEERDRLAARSEQMQRQLETQLQVLQKRLKDSVSGEHQHAVDLEHQLHAQQIEGQRQKAALAKAEADVVAAQEDAALQTRRLREELEKEGKLREHEEAEHQRQRQLDNKRLQDVLDKIPGVDHAKQLEEDLRSATAANSALKKQLEELLKTLAEKQGDSTADLHRVQQQLQQELVEMRQAAKKAPESDELQTLRSRNAALEADVDAARRQLAASPRENRERIDRLQQQNEGLMGDLRELRYQVAERTASLRNSPSPPALPNVGPDNESLKRSVDSLHQLLSEEVHKRPSEEPSAADVREAQRKEERAALLKAERALRYERLGSGRREDIRPLDSTLPSWEWDEPLFGDRTSLLTPSSRAWLRERAQGGPGGYIVRSPSPTPNRRSRSPSPSSGGHFTSPHRNRMLTGEASSTAWSPTRFSPTRTSPTRRATSSSYSRLVRSTSPTRRWASPQRLQYEPEVESLRHAPPSPSVAYTMYTDRNTPSESLAAAIAAVHAGGSPPRVPSPTFSSPVWRQPVLPPSPPSLSPRSSWLHDPLGARYMDLRSPRYM